MTDNPEDAMFDKWVDRQLRAMFDSVAAEPVPEALMKLLRPKDDG